MDVLYAAGVTELYRLIAAMAAQGLGLTPCGADGPRDLLPDAKIFQTDLAGQALLVACLCKTLEPFGVLGDRPDLCLASCSL